jgi:diketogulonate reductase-like aldo/keto reductase
MEISIGMTQSQSVDALRETKIALSANAGAIPALGFGTLIPDPVATRIATIAALEAGFRTLDTAERYRTEREVGDALHEVMGRGEIKREDVFVMTKLWNTNHRPARARAAFERSLEALRLDYIDLYLIHTPFAFAPGDDQDPRDESGAVMYDKETSLLDTWHALESIVDEGKCRAIGLSDCKLQTVQSVYEAARIKPALVQLESHPYNPEWEILDFCKQNGIVMQAFAPLGHSLTPRLLADPVVVRIAAELSKTPAQVLLAWALQRGTAVLTTSKTETRIKENFDISIIPSDAMEAINNIETRVRFNTVVDTGVPGFIARTSS